MSWLPPIEENVVGVAVDDSANRVYLAHSHGIVAVYNAYTLARLATVDVIGSRVGTVTGVAVDTGTHVAHVTWNDISSYTDYGHWSKIEWNGTAYAETDDVAYPSQEFDASSTCRPGPRRPVASGRPRSSPARH